ncbi:hypothetical protein BX666DRAFT_1979679 [Dichotomocladium elegans]|nr:hypothetical protein BX666DRAFT_1979679 [Dichotomocladium elegans]
MMVRDDIDMFYTLVILIPLIFVLLVEYIESHPRKEKVMDQRYAYMHSLSPGRTKGKCKDGIRLRAVFVVNIGCRALDDASMMQTPRCKHVSAHFVLPSNVYLRFGLLIFVNTWLLTVFIRPFRDRVRVRAGRS